jgi:hypothetical protein
MEKRRAFNIMVRKTEGNRPHRKPRFILEECVIQDSALNVTLRRVRVKIVAVQKQKLLHRVFACRLIYPSCKANAAYYIVVCALPGSTIFYNIFGKNLLNVKSVF